VQTEVVKLSPPQPLRTECDAPKNVMFGDDATNNDLINWGIDWRTAFKQCAAKMHRLIQWFNDDGTQTTKTGN
jgi:hypothetical protein